jgi:hypothetical protein
MWQALIAPIAGVFNSWQENKARKNELEQTLHMKKIEGVQQMGIAEIQLQTQKQEDLKGSWKDEYVTIIITIPSILCFVPGGAPIVTAGFEALSTTPEWYQYLFVAVVTAAAGIPIAASGVNKMRSAVK